MLDVCVVEIKGVEPLTSCLQGRRSSQLSYSPIKHIICCITQQIQCTYIKYIEK